MAIPEIKSMVNSPKNAKRRQPNEKQLKEY